MLCLPSEPLETRFLSRNPFRGLPASPFNEGLAEAPLTITKSYESYKKIHMGDDVSHENSA